MSTFVDAAGEHTPAAIVGEGTVNSVNESTATEIFAIRYWDRNLRNLTPYPFSR
jgi:hypothetical protein